MNTKNFRYENENMVDLWCGHPHSTFQYSASTHAAGWASPSLYFCCKNLCDSRIIFIIFLHSKYISYKIPHSISILCSFFLLCWNIFSYSFVRAIFLFFLNVFDSTAPAGTHRYPAYNQLIGKWHKIEVIIFEFPFKIQISHEARGGVRWRGTKKRKKNGIGASVFRCTEWVEMEQVVVYVVWF